MGEWLFEIRMSFRRVRQWPSELWRYWGYLRHDPFRPGDLYSGCAPTPLVLIRAERDYAWWRFGGWDVELQGLTLTETEVKTYDRDGATVTATRQVPRGTEYHGTSVNHCGPAKISYETAVLWLMNVHGRTYDQAVMDIFEISEQAHELTRSGATTWPSA